MPLRHSSFAVKDIISNSDPIFWDFDGVIKDSVGVKTSAFKKLFLPYGQKIAERVINHHEANGGISRFEKIPLYLSWAGENVRDELVEKFCNSFSKAVFQLVIRSPWVPGVFEYLTAHHREKYFVLITATPQDEIEKMLSALKIAKCFRQVFGAQTKKNDAMRSVLDKQRFRPVDALMIGDSETDLLAARANSVPFLLRRTPLNLHVQHRYDSPQFDDLSYEQA